MKCWETLVVQHLVASRVVLSSTELVSYVEESRPPLRSSGQSSWLQNGCAVLPVR
jgi:hypothetical protein